MKAASIPLILACVCLVFYTCGVTGRETIHILVPPTPASMPILLAAVAMDDLEVIVFANHTQAHTLFLRGDIPLLVTGLALGVSFYGNGVPIQIINSYVSGMTGLITRGQSYENFRQLQGAKIVVPFEGSPIEEITRFFVAKEGLDWKRDFEVVYAPLETGLELLRIGKADNVVLPQPFAAIALSDHDLHYAIDYKTRWDKLTNGQDGYPQVGTFVHQAWAKQNHRLIASLNAKIASALIRLQQHPEQTIKQASAVLGYSEALLSASLARTDFALKTSVVLKHHIELYYQTIGKPLHESYQAFFYLDPH